ncbi:hypothetical protein FKM82_030780, partial [Ascaphus truei]
VSFKAIPSMCTFPAFVCATSAGRPLSAFPDISVKTCFPVFLLAACALPADLEQYEVEECLSGMMNEEFDTIVEDGSLPQVAQQLCGLYAQCRRGETAAVREKIAQLCQKKYNVRANVQEVKVSDEDEGSGDEAAE